jgi:hypothetical protein
VVSAKIKRVNTTLSAARGDVFGVSLATLNHGFRFAVSYLGKKLGNFNIALGVSPWAIV